MVMGRLKETIALTCLVGAIVIGTNVAQAAPVTCYAVVYGCRA